MRLIDVDKLNIVVHVATRNKAVCEEIAEEVGRQIVNAPTVNAIPIEWIKKYGVEKNKIVETSLENVLYWLVKDWEKENEV